jgi:hypothetical protein
VCFIQPPPPFFLLCPTFNAFGHNLLYVSKTKKWQRHEILSLCVKRSTRQPAIIVRDVPRFTLKKGVCGSRKMEIFYKSFKCLKYFHLSAINKYNKLISLLISYKKISKNAFGKYVNRKLEQNFPFFYCTVCENKTRLGFVTTFDCG